MLRITGLIFLSVITALGVARPAPAGEYSGPGISADLVLKNPRLAKDQITGRYYFDRGGSRMDLNGAAKYRSLIFNSYARTLITVSRKSSVTVSLKDGRALAAQFGDPPCTGYRRALMLGSERRYGRTIEVWRCDVPVQALRDAGVRRGLKVTVWYDPDLKHFIRKEDNNGVSIELRNIVAARQPPSLFDVPADFATLQSADRLAEVEAPQ